MEEQEIWKDIPGYEGYYQISNIGRVKNIKGSNYSSFKPLILKQLINTVGYYKITLHKNGVRNSIETHRLVAMAFLNHIPNKFKLVVNHKDRNKLNNKVDNLEIVTNRENTTNRRINSTSKYIGVGWSKSVNKWRARILINGKRIFLGYFDMEEDANLAYQNKIKELL